jgi:hypothetical protein
MMHRSLVVSGFGRVDDPDGSSTHRLSRRLRTVHGGGGGCSPFSISRVDLGPSEELAEGVPWRSGRRWSRARK